MSAECDGWIREGSARGAFPLLTLNGWTLIRRRPVMAAVDGEAPGGNGEKRDDGLRARTRARARACGGQSLGHPLQPTHAPLCPHSHLTPGAMAGAWAAVDAARAAAKARARAHLKNFICFACVGPGGFACERAGVHRCSSLPRSHSLFFARSDTPPSIQTHPTGPSPAMEAGSTTDIDFILIESEAPGTVSGV